MDCFWWFATQGKLGVTCLLAHSIWTPGDFAKNFRQKRTEGFFPTPQSRFLDLRTHRRGRREGHVGFSARQRTSRRLLGSTEARCVGSRDACSLPLYGVRFVVHQPEQRTRVPEHPPHARRWTLLGSLLQKPVVVGFRPHRIPVSLGGGVARIHR